MTEPGTTEVREFVFRRLTEPMKVFGWTMPPSMWIVALTVILVAAVFYIALMYYKDSRSVGPWWSILLGTLRTAVYAILAFVFLLPAIQKSEQTTIRSKAVLLFDTSLSMIETRDDPPVEGKDPLKLPSRQDKVLDFMKSDKIDFMKKLTDNNAITAYRFGSGLDEGYFQFANGRFFTRSEWEDLAKHPEKRHEVAATQVMPHEFWSAWLKPTLHQLAPDDWNPDLKKSFLARKEPVMKENADWNEDDRIRFIDLAKYNARMVEKATFEGTNVYQALADTLAREQNNLTRGIVLISDGRSHLGSPEVIEEIKRKAREKKIPILVVGIGVNRPQARIEVVDLRHPKQIQPDDTFRLVAEVKGDGAADQEIKGLQLEVTKVKIDTKETKEDGKTVVTKTETKQDITVVEQRPPKKRNPDEKPKEDEKEPPLAEVSLGQTLILTPPQPPKFDNSPRPRASVEFQIDATLLAQLAAKGPADDLATVMKTKPLAVALASLKGKSDIERRELEAKFAAIKKWGLGETQKDEEYRFKVSVQKHPLDTTPGTEHLSKTGSVRVLKKPLSILVFTSSASKDYQFLRELLIRETQKDLARVTIVFQTTSPGETTHPAGVVQGVPERRFLTEFPGLYRPEAENTKPESEEAINDLATYDVVVAIDPDWTRIKESTGKNIAKWVENGGGLIILAGPLYTKRLSRPGDYKAKLQPIIDVLPVILKDVDTVEVDRQPDSPWNLDFGSAPANLEFLKLTDKPGGFQKDWDAIYGHSTDTESKLYNGFYSFYPVKKATPGSQVIARFMDPKAKTDDNEQMPYFVITDPRSPKRVIWIGSTEVWRLRQADHGEAIHERFWTKLLRYAGARTQGKINKRLTLELGGPYKTDQFIPVDAKALGADGRPIEKGEMKLTLKPRGLVNVPVNLLEQTLKPKVGTDGIFSVQFRLPAPGLFDVELTVPDYPGLSETGTLTVEASNLEKDDTRPDFDTLYRLASDLEEVKNRIPARRDYDELLKRLTRPKLEGEAETTKSADKEKPRLFFDLSNAELIPTCIDKDESVQKSRGKPEDLWDTGFWNANDGKPILSKVLIAVVGLLSLEWLIRKLLRLA